VTIICRQQDLKLVQEVLDSAAAEYEKRAKKSVTLVLEKVIFLPPGRTQAQKEGEFWYIIFSLFSRSSVLEESSSAQTMEESSAPILWMPDCPWLLKNSFPRSAQLSLENLKLELTMINLFFFANKIIGHFDSDFNDLMRARSS
jgi:hypothetical protein